MRHKYSKQVEALLMGIKRLETDPVFAAEIEKLSEIVTPTEEDLIQVEKEFRTFMLV